MPCAAAKNDPCYQRSYKYNAQSRPLLNPCGGGQCTPRPDWGAFSYTCDCSALQDFVAVNNTVPITLPGSGTGVTQTCAPGMVSLLQCTLGVPPLRRLVRLAQRNGMPFRRGPVPLVWLLSLARYASSKPPVTCLSSTEGRNNDNNTTTVRLREVHHCAEACT